MQCLTQTGKVIPMAAKPKQVQARAVQGAVRKADPTKPTPQGRAETAAEKAANASTGGLVPLKKGALSLDVGPRVIAALFGFDQRASALSQELHELKGTKRYEQLTDITLHILKAAKADNRVDLTTAYSGDPKVWGKTLNQIGVALGFREEKVGAVGKNGVATSSVVTSPSVAKYFPMTGETDKNTPDWQRKRTFYTNFLTQVKKCAQAAHAIMEKGIKAEFNQKAGTMMISGSEVRKHFGQERVLLDERKTIGEGDAKVELSEKPSFQALANMGAVVAGAGIEPGGGEHRGARAGNIAGGMAQGAAQQTAGVVAGKMTMGDAVGSICKTLVQAIEKMTPKDKLSDDAVAQLEAAQNAIETLLNT